jgi:hypothetical protein
VNHRITVSLVMPNLFRHLSGVNGFRAPLRIEEGQVKGVFQWFGSVGMKWKGEKGDTP